MIPDHEARKAWPTPNFMKEGARVRSKVDFANVPKGTVGVVLTKDHTGWPIQWELPGEANVFGPGYHVRFPKPLVDWFDDWEADRFLEPAWRQLPRLTKRGEDARFVLTIPL